MLGNRVPLILEIWQYIVQACCTTSIPHILLVTFCDETILLENEIILMFCSMTFSCDSGPHKVYSKLWQSPLDVMYSTCLAWSQRQRSIYIELWGSLLTLQIHKRWRRNVIILIKFSSLAALKVVIIPSASTKLKAGYTGFTLSVCLCADGIASALYLQQYSLDPFHIYTSYQATSEGVSCVKSFSK